MIQVRNVQVPQRASNLALLKWQRQLLELDSYLMTHAFKVLEGQTHDPQQVAFRLNKLRANFEAIRRLPAEDHPIRPQCEAYLAALEDLAQSMHR